MLVQVKKKKKNVLISSEPAPLPCLLAGLGAMPTADALAGIPVATDPLAPPSGTHENPSNSGKEPSGMGPAAIMCNLLPAAGNVGASAPSTGVSIGEGLPPLPLELAEKIRRWEYIDMSELLPEFWVRYTPGQLITRG